MRSIKKIHKAEYRPIADLKTYSPMPSASIDHLDPFIFLNHHGPQKYHPLNNGLPFGPHPHRGMETVTLILDGDILHKDSGGHKSVINAGGVQWMTAGSGLIHAEVSSDEFKTQGGPLEILQLWINLPASHKMTAPKYIGHQKENIPTVKADDGKVQIDIISGEILNTKGAFDTFSDIFLSTIKFSRGGKLEIKVPAENNIFFYIIKGSVKIGNERIEALNLVEFNHDNDSFPVEAIDESIILFGHAKPFNEPIIAHGPFVMNSEEEIQQAYADYRAGKFGEWNG